MILGEESDVALLQALQCRNVLQGRQIVASKVQQLHVLQQEVEAWQDVCRIDAVQRQILGVQMHVVV